MQKTFSIKDDHSVSLENINMKLKSVSMNNCRQFVVEDNLQANLDN